VYAVPCGTYGNSDHDNVLSIALLTIFGQYTAALRLAIRRKNIHVYLMPLGGGMFEIPYTDIKIAMCAATNLLKDELRNSKVKVNVLVWEGSTDEKRAFDYTENETTPSHRGFSSSSRD
jgi:hypothetical protein